MFLRCVPFVIWGWRWLRWAYYRMFWTSPNRNTTWSWTPCQPRRQRPGRDCTCTRRNGWVSARQHRNVCTCSTHMYTHLRHTLTQCVLPWHSYTMYPSITYLHRVSFLPSHTYRVSFHHTLTQCVLPSHTYTVRPSVTHLRSASFRHTLMQCVLPSHTYTVCPSITHIVCPSTYTYTVCPSNTHLHSVSFHHTLTQCVIPWIPLKFLLILDVFLSFDNMIDVYKQILMQSITRLVW